MRNYRMTGPAEVSGATLEAMAAERMISHRSREFRDRLADLTPRLAKVFGTTAPVLVLTCSGTGGLEAAAASVLRRGDRVLSVRQGYFGARFGEIAAFHGAEVDVLESAWGDVPSTEEIRAKAAEGYQAVLLTHNETSTGVLAPLEEWAAAIRSVSDCLILVDVVSSLGAAEIAFDRLGLDVAVGVPQKALACPPGLALVAASERALARAAAPGAGSYYLDLARAAAHARESTTTYTPNLSVLFALEAAVAEIEKEGLENVWSRHAETARLCRETLRARGLLVVPPEPLCSPTVTAVRLPAPTAERVRDTLAARHDVWVSSGRGAWKRDVLRIGHMGPVAPADVAACAEAIAAVTTPRRSAPGGGRREVRVLRTADELGPEWDELAKDLAAPVFHTRAFLRAYEHHPVQKIALPRYLEVRDASGALLAAAPAYLQGDPLGLLGLRENEQAFLSPMWHCPGARVLARDDESLRALGEAFGAQAAETGCARWGFINLEDGTDTVRALGEHGFQREELVPRWVLPRTLAPDGPSYLASLRGSARRELGRQLRRAEDQGARCEIRRADHPDLPRLMEFVAATATRAGSPRYYDPVKLAAFLRELGEPVRVLEVCDAAGATLAVGVSFLEAARLQYWAAGYLRDRPDVAFSPYYRMWWQMLELMWSSGVEIAECGRLNEPFKRKMGLTPRPLVALTGPTA